MCSGDSRGAAPPRTPMRKGSRSHQMETTSASHLQVPGSRISNALAHPLSDSTSTMIPSGGVISLILQIKQPCLSEPGVESMPLQLIALFVMAPCPPQARGRVTRRKAPRSRHLPSPPCPPPLATHPLPGEGNVWVGDRSDLRESMGCLHLAHVCALQCQGNQGLQEKGRGSPRSQIQKPLFPASLSSRCLFHQKFRKTQQRSQLLSITENS